MVKDLSLIQNKKYKVLSGVELGKKARQIFNLDVIDKNDEKVTFVIPEEVYSLNISFFAGLFQNSLVTLKEKLFREKYLFNCNEIIRKNIEDGIFYVLKTKDISEAES